VNKKDIDDIKWINIISTLFEGNSTERVGVEKIVERKLINEWDLKWIFSTSTQRQTKLNKNKDENIQPKF
jgi:hypothetical protein